MTDENINCKVGGQDFIDITNTVIEKYDSKGKVGAKGYMSCNGSWPGCDVASLLGPETYTQCLPTLLTCEVLLMFAVGKFRLSYF